MTATDMVIDRLAHAAAVHGARPMLSVASAHFTYAEIWQAAGRTASAICTVAGANKLVGFFANRDETAYHAIVAILLAGKGYVPLNPKLPDERLRHIIRTADLDTVVVGKDVERRANEVLQELDQNISTLCIASEGEALVDGARPRVLGRSRIAALAPAAVRRPASSADPAYLLFTSGSTGEPKGVPVSNASLCAYLDYICGLYEFGPRDVHSQTFELTFDLSVHDMMCAWSTGGRLVRLAGAELMSPANIIRKQAITSWFSVPSLGLIMGRTGGLKPGSLPSLRVSLFCGEALPASLAVAWSAAAPQGIVENLYGPTEATIAFTRYRWDTAKSPSECRFGLVPIGRAFDGQGTAVIDDDGKALGRPSRGMLLLGGSQVTGRYWKAPDITAEKYVALPGRAGGPWYVTGDLVEEDEAGCIHFIGRSDSQIKFRGYRIELREIEDALRNVVGTELAVALPWPVEGHEIRGIAAVVAGEPQDVTTIIDGLRRALPDYMIPQQVRFFLELPRNLSGKIDRNAIKALLDGAQD